MDAGAVFVATCLASAAATPGDAYPTYAEADLLIRSEKYQAALDTLARADALDADARVHRDTTAKAIYTGFGQLLEAADQLDAAAEVYRQAVRRFPDRPDFYLKAAEVLASRQRFDEARSLIDAMRQSRVRVSAEHEAAYRRLAAKLERPGGAM